MGFFDEAEVKCAAGVGLSALGVGALGIPLAVDGCSEAVEKVVEKAEAVIERVPDMAQDAACFATDTSALLLGSLTPFAPLTTLTMRYMPSACNQEGDEILDALKNAVMDSPFLFGFGGIATYLIEDQISKRGVVDTMKDLGESLATAALSSAVMAGAGRGLRTLHHVRNFKEDFHRSVELYRDTLKAYNLGNALTGGKLQRLEQELQLKAKKNDTPEQAQKAHPHQ